MKKIICLLTLSACFTGLQTYAQTKKTVAKKPTASLSASIAAGQKVYMLNCLTCHQMDGGGVQNMNPPLIKTTYVLGDKGRIIKIVLNGFSEKVPIDGDTFNNVMPPQSTLTDEEIANVLTYVRNSFGNKASAVTVAEVKKIRAAKK